jgi:hypothetical protein
MTSWLDRILAALTGPWGRLPPSADQPTTPPPSPEFTAARRRIRIAARIAEANVTARGGR